MCRFHEIETMIQCLDEAEVLDDEQEWDGCCEDPYDDEEEENEREWCD